MNQLQTNEFYDFAEFRLDLRNRLLRRDEQIVPLTVKEFELLLMLVENAGRVVGKDELLDRIWKDTFVEEGTLTRNISWLRKKLAVGAADRAQLIETLPKRGYRFLPEVKAAGNLDLEENVSVIEREPESSPVIEENLKPALGENFDPGFAENNFNPQRTPVFANQQAGQSRPRRVRRNNFRLLFALAICLLATAVVGFAVYQKFIRQNPPTVILASRVAPFSGFPGREETPAFSPDGRQLAFAWNGGDRKTLDIYVKIIGAGEPVRLTDKGHDTFNPAFSPDGKYVAFFRSFPDRSEIYAVPALGGAERRICQVQSGATSFAWSPDGKTIAVADRISADSVSPATGIVYVDVETGTKQTITAPPDNIRDYAPRFSPDGNSLVFIRAGENLNQDLFIVAAANDRTPRRLTFDETKINDLAWSADGRRIIFTSRRKQMPFNLWQIAAVGGEPELIVAGAKNPSKLAVSPNGKTIAYVESFNNFNVWRFDVETATKQAAASKLIPYIRSEGNPQISPNGAQIVFRSDQTGKSELWLSDAEGKNQRQLTDSDGAVGSPRFSPDGQFIAYDVNRTGKSDIFVVSVEGGAARPLTDHPAHDVIPAWSADGQWIFFSSNRTGEHQIWKTPISGGEAVQITRRGGFEALPALDGKTIFYLKENGIGGLWSSTTEGNIEISVPGLGEASYWRSWTVTQDGVYFIAHAEYSPYRIKFYDFSNKQISEIATVEKTPVSIFPALSATSDGKTILYSQQDHNANSIVLAELP